MEPKHLLKRRAPVGIPINQRPSSSAIALQTKNQHIFDSGPYGCGSKLKSRRKPQAFAFSSMYHGAIVVHCLSLKEVQQRVCFFFAGFVLREAKRKTPPHFLGRKKEDPARSDPKPCARSFCTPWARSRALMVSMSSGSALLRRMMLRSKDLS